jgi:hypothetical protein
MALALLMAWRSHRLTVAGRAYPDGPGDVVFDPQEWHTIDPLQSHRPPLRPRLRSARGCGAWLTSVASEPTRETARLGCTRSGKASNACMKASRGCYELLQQARRRADLRTELTLTMTSPSPLWKLICVKVHNTL